MVAQTKVFVGSLPQGSRPEDLRKLFERFGAVTECDIMNRCGFVHMETEDQASAAIRALHNSTFNGGVITVERGRIKERGQRGGGGGRGGRGGMRGGMDRRGGGPMRGGGPPRDAPYPMRGDRHMGHMRGGDMRGPPMGGMGGMRNGMGGGAPYDRGMDRPPMGGYDDRYNGYGEDRRGFALMDGRGAREQYGAPAPMYPDDRRGYAPVDDMQQMYPDERHTPMYPDDMMDRRGGGMRGGQMPMGGGYDRAPPRSAPPMGNGDMYSRRTPPPMRGAAGGATGGYDRDPYPQPYAPMGRYGNLLLSSNELGSRTLVFRQVYVQRSRTPG
ncbi:RNA-binding protein 4.1 isoform X2 [Leptidea sinapis]|uniref:RRM domain-containing protein n=1 Tax=Leptidea sinapis TaxID=189913 RepID=A0A5E4R3R6_9NEOP|nr:RNA-binding protein 4.1 isoform X2 [Leptidea sinapis]VVD04394.1 unnamed protein product [Leptidea sinapis]